jgi:fumarate hydratase class I/fumarate hydratase subunit alpha
MSTVCDALLDRSNRGDNGPAFVEIAFRPGSGATVHVMLKGGGSDNASRVVMLPPSAGWNGVRDVVMAAVREKASSACPPLLIGVGVGATFDKVGTLAKKALLREIGEAPSDPRLAALEAELLDAVNETGIGAGGLGGDVTALAVHVATAPCHIAALPVAVNMGCCAVRSASIDLVSM